MERKEETENMGHIESIEQDGRKKSKYINNKLCCNKMNYHYTYQYK